MKLSSYHKQMGDNIKLLHSYDAVVEYDKTYISKVFTDTEIPEDVLKLPQVTYGGTGFYFDKAPPLPDEIEHTMPDYHLYDDWIKLKIDNGSKQQEFSYYTDYSIGFMTRGCIRECDFCVNKNYKQCNLHSRLSEFLDKTRPYICLWDDNVLACKDWKQVFRELQLSGKRFKFRQGLDERLLTEEKCDIIFNQSKWIGDYIFAFDNIKDFEVIETKLKLIRKYTSKIPKFYVFCGFNHNEPNHYTSEFWVNDIENIFKRIELLMKYQCLPYIMRYIDYSLSPYRGMYINIARWCNQPSFFKKKTFREFCEVNGENSACYKYYEEFEKANPRIAENYFNLRYGT